MNKGLALRIIVDLYKDKKDKVGRPAMLHPLCVASQFYGEKNEKLYVCALLHDVIEDGYMTDVQLRLIFPGEYVDTILVLTRRKDQTYFEYIDSLIRSGDRDAMLIKCEDLKHNIHRNNGMFPDLLKRHQKALALIQEAMI